MTELEKATAIIAAASGADVTAVAEQLQSDESAQNLASTLFEVKFKEQRDQGDQRATLKTRKEVEKAFKAAGIADASFSDLPAAISALKDSAEPAQAGQLSDEQALKLPAVVAALNEVKRTRQQEIDAATAAVRSELSAREAQFTQQRTDQAVRAKAEALVATLNPNFTPGKEDAQRERLIRDILSEGGYKLSDDGAVSLVDEDGNLLPGKLGNPATLDDRVRELSEQLYGLPVSQPAQNAGVSPQQAATGDPYQGPTTQADYEARFSQTRPGSPERVKLMADFDTYKKSQNPAA